MTRTIRQVPDFNRFVPFVERTRWFMVRHLINSGISETTFRKRSGWSRSKIRATLFSANRQIKIKDVAEWFFCVDGSLLRFECRVNDVSGATPAETSGDLTQKRQR